MKALLGLHEMITNVNIKNEGQIPNLPLGHVVETNALFRKDQLRPIYAGPMPKAPLELTRPHIHIHELLIKAFDHRNLKFAKEAILRDPFIQHLKPQDKLQMFDEIVQKLKPYLSYYTQS